MNICSLCTHTIEDSQEWNYTFRYCKPCMKKLPGSLVAMEISPDQPPSVRQNIALDTPPADLTLDDGTRLYYGRQLLIPSMGAILSKELDYTAFNPTQHFCRIPVLSSDYETLTQGFDALEEIRTILTELAGQYGDSPERACTHADDECNISLYRTTHADSSTPDDDLIYLEGMPYVRLETTVGEPNQIILPHFLDNTSFQGACTEYALTPEIWDSLYSAFTTLTQYVNLADFPTYHVPQL